MHNSVKTDAAAKHSGRRKGEAAGYLSDLGKGLGSVVQTRDGGYLASMNPFDTEIIPTREAPKLTMQISRPIIMETSPEISGLEVFQNFAGMGLEELGIKLLSLTSIERRRSRSPLREAIVGGRNRELAKSAAAKSIAALKAMAVEMNAGRKEKIGIWNVREEALVLVEETVSFSLQKMEAMAVDGLKLQAGVPEDEAPFDVLGEDCASIEDWLKKGKGEEEEGKTVLLMVLVQLRDPARRYEAVGAPMISMVQVAGVSGLQGARPAYRRHEAELNEEDEKRVGWGEAEAEADGDGWWAMEWPRAGRRAGPGEREEERMYFGAFQPVMAGMWLKLTRNPDVKLLLHL
ncbi:hypothetical protein KSP40_PGU020392 [Platanthera guangdongensis]|uniref:PMI1/PMIR1-2 C-terminal domain-containing protein n=1 Tax=Platanthera guangdongensis TaxID=2320717 RepID=A0ABR2LDZ7_9ASPA